MAKPLKLITWNVNGLRACARNGFVMWLKKESPDILCLQETKAGPEQIQGVFEETAGHFMYINSAAKKGYSGVLTLAKEKPLKVSLGIGRDAFDSEGRVITTEYPEFILYNVYFPNGGRDHGRVGFKLAFYEELLKQLAGLLKKGRRVIVCGDFNTAHREIDLKNPKSNQKTSGFLPEERVWIDRYLEAGFTDIFRSFHPEPGHYTWWSYMFKARERNIGWRIDYHLVSHNLIPRCKDAYLLPDAEGSDHCPAVLVME